MDVVERLERAAKAGERLTIVYHGGSQPGTAREIGVIRVTPLEVRARCYASNTVKTFKVSKIEIVGDEEVIPSYDPQPEPAPPLGILDVLSRRADDLKSFGWHVEIDEDSISVHRYLKNGRPQKRAAAGILRRPESPTRPWYVYGPDFAAARTLGNLLKASALFLEQAEKHAPNRSHNRQRGDS